MAHFGPTRRSLLQGTLAASALGLTGFPARAEVQWKKYAGTTIEANLIKGPRGELLQKYASEFTELTGIKVESEVIPEQQQRQKAVIELTSGKPSFDVIHVSYHVQKRQFEKAGWLADLTGVHERPEPDRARPHGRRFLRRRPAIRPERQGRDAFAALVGRLFHSVLEQGAVRQEGRDAAENLRRDGRRRREAQRPRQRHLRLYRPRPAQRQHDAVDQFLPRLWRRVSRRQGQHPDRRPGGDRGHQDCISGC